MRRGTAAVVVACIATTLAGCASTPGPTLPMPLPSTPMPSATASPSTEEPTPGGSVTAEQSRFDAALATVLAENSDPAGRVVIDALVAAGFDKAAMQLTPDTTAIGLDADSIQFSVRIGDDCIIGQSGNVGYHSIVLPVLSTGQCLVGSTRPIDW